MQLACSSDQCRNIELVYSFLTIADGLAATLNKQTGIMNIYLENNIAVLKMQSDYLINKYLST